MIRTLIGILVLTLATATTAYATAAAQAPEIDPATAMSGLTLLLGGLAVVRGRIKKKKQD